MTRLRFHRPVDLEDVLELLESLQPHAIPLAGGVEITEQVKDGSVEATDLVDLKHVERLRHIDLCDGDLRIGATVTHRRIACDPRIKKHAPALAYAAATLGNVRVRGTGTLGGNLSAKLVVSDLAVVLSAIGARAVLRSTGSQRQIPVGDRAAMTVRPGEVLTAVEVPTRMRLVGYTRFPRVGTPEVAAAVAVARAGESSLQSVVVACEPVGVLRVPLADAADIPRSAQAVVGAAATALADAGASDYHSHLGGVLAGRALRAAARAGGGGA